MSWWPRGLRRKSHTLVDQSFSGSNPGRAKILFMIQIFLIAAECDMAIAISADDTI